MCTTLRGEIPACWCCADDGFHLTDERGVCVGWTIGQPYAIDAPEGFAAFHRQWRALQFPDAALDNGYAIMHYDGVFVAAEAACQAATQLGGRTLSAADVATFLQNSHDSQLRAAASGTLSFFGGVSWAYNRPVPVVAIPAGAPLRPWVARPLP